MKRFVCLGLVCLATASLFTACSSKPSGESAGFAQNTGTFTLALSGQGSLGGQYQLTSATFTISGPVNRTVSGEPDTITESLPVGVYTIKLENGWLLRKTAETGPSNTTATLASANPQTFVINGAQTTAVSWVFNVSGADPDQDDLEVVTVTNGAVAISAAAAEVGWANIATGLQHACGITIPGQLKCWGSNNYGQLGYGDTSARLTPATSTIALGASRTVKRVVVARDGNFSCALLDDNTIKCWGYNSSGQLGYGDTTTRLAPPDPVVNLGSSNTAKTLAAGPDFVCAVLDTNAVKCWGNNASGQLGYGDTNARTAPPTAAVALGAGNAAKSVELGAAHACVLLANNTIKCWGYNYYGQLGNGDSGVRYNPDNAPVNLGAGRTAKSLVAGANHTCAILDNDAVKCWGYNSYGQLGYGDTTTRYLPETNTVNLGAGRTAKRLSAGTAHTCALLDDDTIKCWGMNSSGQLGYEDVNQRSAPPALTVGLGTGRVAHRLLGSANHNCVLLNDNSMKCWGGNPNGAFGIGSLADNRGDNSSEMGDFLPEVLP